MAEDTPRKFVANKLLAKARRSKFLTQEQLAEALKVNPVTVSRWERGESKPSLQQLDALCTFFAMTAQELGYSEEDDEHSTSLLQESKRRASRCSNVPYIRNRYFIGHADDLERLYQALSTGLPIALTQVSAISGLGGIGKTQMALEYLHRYRNNYEAVFWMRADLPEHFRTDIFEVAQLVGLPEATRRKQDLQALISALIHWLDMHTHWLLILDNVEEGIDISDLLSAAGDGHILLTTRSQVVANLAYNILLDCLPPEEGALLLLRKADMIGLNDSLAAVSSVDQEIAKEISHVLDGLPLALDLAGSYIRAHAYSLPVYLERYYSHRDMLLHWKAQRKQPYSDYSHSVATALQLSFERVEQECSAAADFLRLCAFLDPESIPEELMLENPAELGPSTLPIAQNVMDVDRVIEILLRYSLIRRHHTSGTLVVHRLVQAVMRDSMTAKEQRYWADRTVRSVHHAFFSARLTTMQQYDRYLSHAMVCARLIVQWELKNEASAHLLFLASCNLEDRGWYAQAGPLCIQALHLYEALFGPHHSTVTGSLALLAGLYMKQREYTLSEPLEQRAYSMILEQIQNNRDSFDTPTILHHLVARYIEQGKFDLAILFCQKALDYYEQDSTLDLVGKALVCGSLVKLYMIQKDYISAKSLCESQKSIYEQLPAPDCYRITESLRSLANIAIHQGELIQAEQLARRARDIDMEALEEDHPDIVYDIDLLAVIAERQSNYREAEKLLRQTLEMSKKRFGANAYTVAVHLGNLAVVLSKQQYDEQATSFYEQAEDIFDQRTAFEAHTYLNFLRSYAVHLKKIGRMDEALQRMHLVLLIEDQSAEKYGDLLKSDNVIRDEDSS